MGHLGRHWAVGAVFAAAAVLLTAGCDPADGLESSVVSTTTDQLATHALKRDKVDVRWLSCDATTKKREADVDCVGRTDDQQKITVNGRVDRQVGGKCVQGRLTATVGARTVFDVRGLGDCTPTPSHGPVGDATTGRS